MSDLNEHLAIDPAALILKGRALEIYYLIKHPHVPSIQEALRKATPEERKATLARAKALAEYAKEVEVAIETMPSK